MENADPLACSKMPKKSRCVDVQRKNAFIEIANFLDALANEPSSQE